MVIELVRKVNVMLSPDGTWYGVYRFKQIPRLTEAESFIDSLEAAAEEAGYEVSDKIALTGDGESWVLRMTFKGMPRVADAEAFMHRLKKTALAYREKGQGKLEQE